MGVKLRQRNRGASTSAIKRILPQLATSGHEDWIEFLNQNDGAVPERNEFDVGTDNGSGVQAFYSAEEAISEQQQLSDRMPKYLLRVADAEGGNYVCLELLPEAPGVVFWDHETEETTRISSSFSKFLEDLRPSDPKSVNLKPGQVLSAWIDPALLETERQKKK